MADQFNPFSLDPLQLEQDQIAQQMRLAEATALRRGTGRGPSQFDIGNDSVIDTAANMAQTVDMPRLRDRQNHLSSQFQQSFDEATAGAPAQIKALVSNPATRPQGMQLLLEYNQDQMDKINGNDPSRFVTKPGATNALPGATAAAGVGGGGGQYDMQAIIAGMASRNPHTKEMAKAAYKEASRQVDPDKLPVMPDGSAGQFDPNQVGAQQQKARQAAAQTAVNAGTELIKTPEGDRYRPKADPNFDYMGVLGLPGQGQNQTQSFALPGSMAAQGQQQAPQSMPPAPQQQALPQANPQQPDMVPVPNGPNGSRGTFMVPRPVAEKMLATGTSINFDQIPPQQLPAVYQSIMAQPDRPQQAPAPNQQAPTAATPLDLSGRPKGDVQKGYESYIDPGSKIQPPAGPLFSESQTKMYQDRVNENHATMAKMEAAYHPGELSHLVEKAAELVAKPHLSGKAAAMWMGVTTAPPNVDEATANTIALNNVAQAIAGLKVKANQSTQISDFDFKVGQMQAPSIEMPLQGQQKVIDSLREDAKYLDGMHNAVRKGVYNNVPANEVAAAFSSWYRDATEYNAKLQGASGNPPSAPAGSSPAAGRSQAAPFEYKEPGTAGRIWGFLNDPTAPGDMARALPSTLAGIATNPTAWKDAIMDKGRGLQNFLGFGDRDEAVKLSQQHEGRAAQDPQGYGAGYNFAGTVPETLGYAAAGPEVAALKGVRGALDLAKVAAPSLVRGAGVGAVSGASRPEESWGTQAVNSVWGAAGGLAGSLLPAALPATSIAKAAGGRAVEDLLSEFPSFRSSLSRSQINPSLSNEALVGGVPTARAGRQVQAMSDDIVKQAGLKPGPIDINTVSAAKTATGKNVDNILNGTTAKIDTADKTAFQGILSDPNAANALAKSKILSGFAQEMQKPNPIQLKPAAVNAVWKEAQTLGNSGPEKAVKEAIENLITRNMPPDVAAQFKTLGGQLSTLGEIEAAYGKGTGKLGGSGYLTPSGITTVGEANPGGIMDRARRALGQMNVGDVKTPDRGWGFKDAFNLPFKTVRDVASNVARVPDFNALGASSSTKAILNSLRGTLQAGQPAVAQELYNAQK
jgi:hypothetical protein